MLRPCTTFTIPAYPLVIHQKCHVTVTPLSSLGHLAETYKGHFISTSCPSENTNLLSHNTTALFVMSSSEDGTDFDSTAEMSLSPLTNHTNGPVGLSDPQYVIAKRKMLDVVNRLRATG